MTLLRHLYLHPKALILSSLQFFLFVLNAFEYKKHNYNGCIVLFPGPLPVPVLSAVLPVCLHCFEYVRNTTTMVALFYFQVHFLYQYSLQFFLYVFIALSMSETQLQWLHCFISRSTSYTSTPFSSSWISSARY